MRVGFQGETHSYSHRAVGELFPEAEPLGLPTFAGAFAALAGGATERLVLPIENSTTGSVLPVLDRLVDAPASIVGEHRVEVRHALVGVPGTALSDIQRVRSHPEALAQAESMITANAWTPVPAHDTAGAVREVASHGDPAEAALAPAGAARSHGLVVLMNDVVDREHNTTRFVVLAPGEPVITDDANKSSVAFQTQHLPGALALALTELGLRGANLTRIESRPSGLAWSYRFFVDLMHEPGADGLRSVFEPPLSTVADFHHLGTYPASG